MLYEKKILSKKLYLATVKMIPLNEPRKSSCTRCKIFNWFIGAWFTSCYWFSISSKKEKKRKNIYVLISDGELNEGTTWESLYSQHHKLNNLCVIIDYNKLQSLTFVSKTIKLEPIVNKIKSFNCFVKSINGHNINQLINVLKYKSKNKPKVIIANTIKGKGVSFMENNIAWHYKSPNFLELNQALKEIENA